MIQLDITGADCILAAGELHSAARKQELAGQPRSDDSDSLANARYTCRQLAVIYRHVAVELDRASRVTPGED